MIVFNFFKFAIIVTCVWDGLPGHIVACWESRLGSKGRTQTAYPAACAPGCWICGRPGAGGGPCQAGRSPALGGSSEDSGRRMCGHMECPEAAPVAADKCGTPGHRPPPDGSCTSGSPSCGGSGHTQDTKCPGLARLAWGEPLHSLGCPSLLFQHNLTLAQMTAVGLWWWEGAQNLLSHKLH